MTDAAFHVVLAALWPLRAVARLLPADVRARVMRQGFFAKVLAHGPFGRSPDACSGGAR